MKQLEAAGIPVAGIKRVCEQFGAKDVAVFGSFVRNQAGPESDLDLLVTLPKGASLLDLVGLQLALEKETGRKVDVLTRGGLSPFTGPVILAESVLL